jgi:hypothetical protein
MAKRVMRAFKIDEISGVDRPAQQGARVAIMKRNAVPAPATEAIAKGIYDAVSSSSGNPPGARSFADLIAATEECQRQSAVSQELWPYFDALTDSIRSIVADQTMDEPGKINAIRQSIDQFTTAVTAAVPDAEDEIEKLFTDPAASGVFYAGLTGPTDNTGEPDMSDLEKKVGDLTSQVADLTKRAEKAEADLAKANASVADLTKAADITKNDEVLKVGETEVRKSAVGEANFAFMKAQQAEITKARDETEMERLTKRASDELGQLPGEPIAKAKALKAVNGMPAEEKATIETMLKAGQAAIAKGFTKFGVGHGAPDAGDPEGKLEAMAKAKAEKENVPYATAYDKVLKSAEGAALYGEMRNARMNAAE